MKVAKAELLNNVVSVYDQTKTTIFGNAHLKSISGVNYLGPSLNKWLDVFVDSGIVPVSVTVSQYGRVFVSSSETTTSTQIAMYSFDFVTGSTSYVGKVIIHTADTAATTTVLRGFKIHDNAGVTGWKILYTTTGSVLINGGLYVANNVGMADFTFVGTDIPFATGNNQKATYFYQDPSNIGVNQLNVASAGSVLDQANNILYVHNGVAATHQYYAYNVGTAPTYASNSVTVSVGSPGVVTDIGHTYNNNDPVVFTAGTLPTGLTVGTTYFVRSATPLVSYQLSATTGGASINTTGSPSSGAILGRAFGTTGSNFLFKTGNLPALSGTLLLVDSEDYAVPQHTVNSGLPCAFFTTTTTMYLGKLSDLSSGVTAWPGLVSANNNGPSTTVAQNARAASWSNLLDHAIFNTASSFRLILKQAVNTQADRIFGRTNIQIYEAQNPEIVYLGANAETNVIGLDFEQGWLFMAINTVGQRGIMAIDVRSDSFFDYSYIVTKVLDIDNSSLKFISSVSAFGNQTDNMLVQYRTSGFGSPSGGWLNIEPFADLSTINVNGQIQFKIQFESLNSDSKGLHKQINELFIGYESNTEISDYWEFSDDWSDNNVPSRVAFRLKQAYVTSVPTLYFRAHDLSDALLINNNTITNAANFEYSTDNGNSWNPLGVIPNTVGTLIRYSFVSPPGVDIRPSIRES